MKLTPGGSYFNDFAENRLAKFRLFKLQRQNNSHHAKGSIAQCPLNMPLRVMELWGEDRRGEFRGPTGRFEGWG